MTPEQAKGMAEFFISVIEMETPTTRKIIAAVPEDKAQSIADKVARMQAICRVRKLCNLILDDNQARGMLRSCVDALDE